MVSDKRSMPVGFFSFAPLTSDCVSILAAETETLSAGYKNFGAWLTFCFSEDFIVQLTGSMTI